MISSHHHILFYFLFILLTFPSFLIYHLFTCRAVLVDLYIYQQYPFCSFSCSFCIYLFCSCSYFSHTSFVLFLLNLFHTSSLLALALSHLLMNYSFFPITLQSIFGVYVLSSYSFILIHNKMSHFSSIPFAQLILLHFTALKTLSLVKSLSSDI